MNELLFLYLKMDKTKAYEFMYKKYYKKVSGLCYKILVNKAEVEDAAQEIFLKIFEKIDTFRFSSDIGTWIYRISINHLFNKNKKLDFHLELDEKKLQTKIESKLELKEIEEHIAAALNELKEVEKKIFILREIEGLKYKEIGTILNLKQGTVKSKLHYVKLKLRNLLEGFVGNDFGTENNSEEF